MIQTFLTACIFSFSLALPIGAGSIKMMQNGLNKTPIHAFFTGTGMNVIDICMMILYYYGLSYIFSFESVQMCLYVAGMGVLSYLAVGCFTQGRVEIIDNVKSIHAKYSQSFKDGIFIALVPSSLIYWVTTYGTILSGTHGESFFIACMGILTGFFINNWFYTLVAHIIKKVSSDKVIKGVNYVSGTILFGFVAYFMFKFVSLFF